MAQLEDTISYIRLIGTEFSSVTDATLETWYNFTLPFVSSKQFGNLYTRALAYRICHSIKMANLAGGSGSSDGVDPTMMMLGGSVSEGETSVSMGSSQSTNLQPDAELALTIYGLQYLQLRRMCVSHITISGADDMDSVISLSGYRRHTWYGL